MLDHRASRHVDLRDAHVRAAEHRRERAQELERATPSPTTHTSSSPSSSVGVGCDHHPARVARACSPTATSHAVDVVRLAVDGEREPVRPVRRQRAQHREHVERRAARPRDRVRPAVRFGVEAGVGDGREPADVLGRVGGRSARPRSTAPICAGLERARPRRASGGDRGRGGAAKSLPGAGRARSRARRRGRRRRPASALTVPSPATGDDASPVGERAPGDPRRASSASLDTCTSTSRSVRRERVDELGERASGSGPDPRPGSRPRSSCMERDVTLPVRRTATPGTVALEVACDRWPRPPSLDPRPDSRATSRS